MESEEGGSERSGREESPAQAGVPGTTGKRHLLSEGPFGCPFIEVTTQEKAAISQFLKQPGAPAAGAGRASALAWAGLRLAAIVLLAAGVGVGLGDGDEFDDVGCTVAQQPGGTSHRARSAQTREGAGGKLLGSEGGAAGAAGGGGGGGRPECEVRAERCANRMADGQCQLLNRRCRLLQVGSAECGVRNEELMEVLGEIRRDVAAVARGNFELRRENEELRTLHQEGFFKFALRVDGSDFRDFAAIMALGHRRAAADFLEVPRRTFYDRVGKWVSRSKDYQRMWRLVEWRSRTGRRITVRLEDSVGSGEPSDKPENPVTVRALLDPIAAADNRDYPAILRQILGALAEQNAENWAAVRTEAVEIIKEEVGPT